MIAAVAAAVLLSVASPLGADDDDGADVKVSTFADGRCGNPRDSLPPLISRKGARPGDVAGDVTVCVANRGDGTGQLSLRVHELADRDSACTGTEPAQDTTCGGGRRGELSASLLQQVGLGTCPSVPSTTDPTLTRWLPALQASSLVLVDRLRRGQVVCVRLLLRYEPPDANAAVVSQSDRTTWRYAFTLATTGDS